MQMLQNITKLGGLLLVATREVNLLRGGIGSLTRGLPGREGNRQLLACSQSVNDLLEDALNARHGCSNIRIVNYRIRIIVSDCR